jgi:hypothetical protein
MRICVCACCLFLLAGICSAQDTNFPVGPQYLMTFGSPQFARPIATPSLSFETPFPEAGTSEPSAVQVPTEQYQAISQILDLQRQQYLPSVYWGIPVVSVIEISFREPEGEGSSNPVLPASITESGVTALTDVQALRERGYGITLPEAAQHWKGRKGTVPHVYTNSDIERLRNAS